MVDSTQPVVPVNSVHKCPKCDGLGWLRYNPAMPFGDSASVGPWRCPVCIDGVIYGSPTPSAEV